MLGIKKHVLEMGNSMVILPHTLTHFHEIFTQFGLFWLILGHFQLGGYRKACTRAREFNGDTFTHSHALLHAISHNYMQFSCNLGYFGQFWAIFNMLGIKKYVLQLENSMQWWYFYTLSRTPSISNNNTRIDRSLSANKACLGKILFLYYSFGNCEL